MLISNADSLNLAAFNPENANPDATSNFSGIFKGMIFAILAFIGFEAAAPLGEEAREPRKTIPRAVVYSAVLIGALLRALLVRVGLRRRLRQLPDAGHGEPRPVARSRQGVLAHGLDPRLLRDHQLGDRQRERGRQRGDPRPLRDGSKRRDAEQLARTHPEYRTPHIAIILNVVGGTIIALLLGWKWGPLLAFATIATAITVVVILIYIAVCLGTIVYYLRERRSEFNPILHFVFPVLGAAAFAFPLYYQYKDWPDNPLGYGNWVAIIWIALGIVLTIARVVHATAGARERRSDLPRGGARRHRRADDAPGPS